MTNIYLVYPKTVGTIAPELYGVFCEHLGSVIYDGIFCGDKAENINGFRKSIIDGMHEARIPLVRWPGGCFAETYDWRDGIGPVENRPVRVNWWMRSDGRFEPNKIGTDEFLDFCRLTDTEPYIAANLTSTTPLDIRDWVDYCNSPEGTTTLAALRAKNGHKAPYNVRYWGVGNENWGGGGNMTAQYYSDEYRRYATVMDNTCDGMKLISCGANSNDYSWTRDLLGSLSQKPAPMSGMSIHYYCGAAGDTVNFSNAEWDQLISQAGQMQELIERHWGSVKSLGMEAQARLCVDEWGCWHPGGTGPSKGKNLFEQQATMRDAVVTALTLNIFNNNCDKVMLAASAQLVNCLHSLFLSADDKCIKTPIFHVYNMYKEHQNARAIEVCCDENISASASVKNGKMTLTLANLSAEKSVSVNLCHVGYKPEKEAELTVLSNSDLHSHNTFENPDCVMPVTTRTVSDGTIDLAAGSIVSISFAVNE